ncbi:GroES-like zinc-binding alcohol dehydrogenase family protein [Gossypium australe]|uniref:GroES-like zinc-binding alcohol dehydrogenase family protein n=1 Tax=Gossypium australe TaxID=47621 RepID=A0A5B6VND6_9ROSI|nr:GroES-like zinc-binding alcohol dehydrogenase family protein [Gossypium australe]
MEACLSSQHCLEQPGSPIPAELKRATKKVRNKALSESDPGVQITGGEESVKESFKEKLMTNSEQGNGKDVMLLNDDDFELLEGNVSVSKEGPYPKSSFSDRVQKNRELCVIVRPLGRSIGYRALMKIYLLWKLSQPDYNKALTKGPLVVIGHYLMSEFLYQIEVLVESDGLLRLQSCRIDTIPRAIDGMIGAIVKIDYNTTIDKRGKFARFRVVIDLNKPLLSQINIDGSRAVLSRKVEAIKNLELQSKNRKGSKVVETSSDFGPWMQDTVVKEGNNDQRMDIVVVENIQRRKKGKGKIPQGSGLIDVVTKDRLEV